MNSILVVGSVAYDSITTPSGHRDRVLGGSANYFSVAASQFAPVRVVGVVGEDYNSEHLRLIESRGVDMRGLQQVAGKTFAWSGKYEKDMNEAVTLATHLNVFENFHPAIPVEYRDSDIVFLANIDPVLQMQVLEQVKKPKLVAADTMNYWIQSKKADLLRMLERIDVLLINEMELQQLTGCWNTIQGVREVLKMGPKCAVIKRGEYGFVLYHDEKYLILPAFPIAEVVDPTGAGDTFAGGFLGTLAQMNQPWNRDVFRTACVNGCLLASFTVQDFGLDRLLKVTPDQLQDRLLAYGQVIG
jgi:sugar/nucleoside kinase (ribokinase family)